MLTIVALSGMVAFAFGNDREGCEGQGGYNQQDFCHPDKNCSMCSSHNDPHITTLDGLMYDHHQPGDYSYVTACQYEYMPFEIIGNHYPCSSGSPIMCIGEIKIKFDTTLPDVVLIKDSGGSYVAELNSGLLPTPTPTPTPLALSGPAAGAPQMQAEYAKSGSLHTFAITTGPAAAPIGYAYVSYSDYGGNLQIWLSNEFQGSACGLCGQFNNDQEDDFLDATGFDYAFSQAQLHGTRYPQDLSVIDDVNEYADTYKDTSRRRLLKSNGNGNGNGNGIAKAAHHHAGCANCEAECNDCSKKCNFGECTCEERAKCERGCRKCRRQCDGICLPRVEGDRNGDGELDCYDVAYDCCLLKLAEIIKNGIPGWANPAISLAEFKQQFLAECATDGALLSLANDGECKPAEELLADGGGCNADLTKFAEKIAEETKEQFACAKGQR